MLHVFSLVLAYPLNLIYAFFNLFTYVLKGGFESQRTTLKSQKSYVDHLEQI